MKLTIALMLAAIAGLGQQLDNQEQKLNCSSAGRSGNDDQARHCEMKEFTLSGVRGLTLDAGGNGGVQVKGWSRADVLVRAQVQTWTPAGLDPRGMASQIQIQTAGGVIQANGPVFGNNRGWAVPYEVFAPHRTDLSLKARNGGLAILDVTGNIQFETINGGVKLERLAGNVRGKTHNGGVSIDLAGTRWEGQELRAETT